MTDNEFIHYSPYGGGNASEYIKPGGRIDITSHGMGSGIYGLSRGYINKNPPNNKGDNEYTFKIDSPYVISNEKECNKYIESSKYIMRRLQQLMENKKNNPDLIVTEENLREIAIELIKKIHNPKKHDIKTVTKALVEFWHDYHTRADFVEMPINYVLKAEGNDGVMSTPYYKDDNNKLQHNPCHRWSTGDVKFIPYPSDKIGDIMPVAYIMARDGINKPVTSLVDEGYKFKNNVWVKEKEQILDYEKEPLCDCCNIPSWKCHNKPCRVCGKPGHKPFVCPTRHI